MKQKISGKSFMNLLLGVALVAFCGLACSNPLAKYTKQYNCSMPGEPDPQTADDYIKRAERHIESNGYANRFDQCAFDAASEAVRLDPKNDVALSLRASLYITRSFEGYANRDEKLVRGSLDGALADYTEAIRLAPEQFRHYYYRSSVYESAEWLGDTRPQMLADLSKAAELCKNDCYPSIFEKRGKLNLELANYGAAVDDFTRAIKLEPSKREYYESRAQAYRKLGNTELAERDERLFPAETPTGSRTDKPTSVSDSKSTSDVPKTISGGVINGKATNLVKPAYPPAAKTVRASGTVNVQVTVDEKGNVISASAVSGHPLLRAAAVQAARESKFSPTLLSGSPVKVSGVIVYNFTPE